MCFTLAVNSTGSPSITLAQTGFSMNDGDKTDVVSNSGKIDTVAVDVTDPTTFSALHVIFPQILSLAFWINSTDLLASDVIRISVLV